MKIIRQGAFYILENGHVTIDGWQFDCDGKAPDFAAIVNVARRAAAAAKLRNAAFALAEVARCLPDGGDDFDTLLLQAQHAVDAAIKIAGAA